MPSPPRDQVESILADIVREHLTRSEAIRVPGLGTFTVRHLSSSVERSDAGDIRLRPPADEIDFKPEQ